MMPTINNVYRPHSRQKPLDDPLRPSRGLINGLLCSLVFWVVIGVIIAFCVGGYLDFGPL